MTKRTRKALTAQAVEQEMEQHDGLVHAFIRRQGGGDIPYDDALQAGRIGLWRALEGYDPTRGTTFSTYAWVAIMRHIQVAAEDLNREFRDWPGEIPAAWAEVLPEDRMEEDLILEALRELVGRLPERLHRVVVARYGLGDEPPRTLRDVGQSWGSPASGSVSSSRMPWLGCVIRLIPSSCGSFWDGTPLLITGELWRRTQRCAGGEGGR